MAEPITPKFMADTVICQNINIQYNQTWDGAAWVIDPNTVIINGYGRLAETGDVVANASIAIIVTDLPMAGQDAIQALLDHMEDLMATKYA